VDPKDELSAMNRDPGKFAGKSVDFKARVGVIREIRANAAPLLDLQVLGPGNRKPRNLTFTLSTGMKARLLEIGIPSRAIVQARISGKMEDKPSASGLAKVAVKKIELIDATDGTVITTIEE